MCAVTLVWFASYIFYFMVSVGTSHQALAFEYMGGCTQLTYSDQKSVPFDRNFELKFEVRPGSTPYTDNHAWKWSGFAFSCDEQDAMYSVRRVTLLAVPFWFWWLLAYIPIPILLVRWRHTLFEA